MSDPDIRTLSVRLSADERRSLEDFARISGVTIEELIRQALFLPPLDARARRHLRLVHSAVPDRVATSTASTASSHGWREVSASASASSTSPAAVQRD